LVALVIWVLSQVIGQKVARPNAPPAGNPRPQQPAGGGLRDEIERFLREAREQQEVQQKEQEQTPRERELGERGARQWDESNSDSEKKKKQERQRRKAEKQRELARQRAKELANSGRKIPIESKAIEDLTVVGPAPSLSEQVSVYMDSNRFRESTSHLGEKVGLADERLEAHLHQAFDHRVGRLSNDAVQVDRGAAATVQTVWSGTQLAAMLRDPLLIRNAIVLNEIFVRPEHRWK
jgi:hypothetical protein